VIPFEREQKQDSYFFSRRYLFRDEQSTTRKRFPVKQTEATKPFLKKNSINTSGKTKSKRCGKDDKVLHGFE